MTRHASAAGTSNPRRKPMIHPKQSARRLPTLAAALGFDYRASQPDAGPAVELFK